MACTCPGELDAERVDHLLEDEGTRLRRAPRAGGGRHARGADAVARLAPLAELAFDPFA
jgi:hypothetical protein